MKNKVRRTLFVAALCIISSSAFAESACNGGLTLQWGDLSFGPKFDKYDLIMRSTGRYNPMSYSIKVGRYKGQFHLAPGETVTIPVRKEHIEVTCRW